MRLSDITVPAAAAWRHAGEAVDGLRSPTIRLGVTGLARSGKTIFITALVHNLVSGGYLPGFAAAREGRILRAWLEPQPDPEVPRFAYETHLEKLAADPPEWPESTRHISQLRVTIEYRPASGLRRAFGTKRLHLDIVDYPGEWLLDLPLLDQDYAAWSRGALAFVYGRPATEASKVFAAFLGDVEASGPLDEQRAIEGARLFTAHLHALRAGDHALSIAGPGRFLLPGEREGSPLLTFFPLPMGRGEVIARGTLVHLLEQRYEAYRTKVVRPFYHDHFARLDRQIVLVDVMAALDAGKAAVEELQDALVAVLASFRPGANTWLSMLLLSRRIDRVLLAATKADHLHASSHDRLRAVLELLTERAARRTTGSGALLKAIAIASARATREAEVTRQGVRYDCIAGVPMPGERIGGRIFDGKSEAVVFPGDLPERPEDALAHGRRAAGEDDPGADPDTCFVRFRPPKLKSLAVDGAAGVIPGIRLDQALDFLLGDHLQ